jgi:thymidylate synthase
MNQYDEQYQNIIRNILSNGLKKEDRTGVGTISIFGKTMEIDLSDGFPLLTLRKIPFRLIFEETMFFLRGQTDTKILEEKDINIWKGNTSRHFLDQRGLHSLEEGDMGKGYGYQWRRFNDNIDQVSNVLNGLRDNPFSRRHIINAWNPNQEHEMALPPCHILHQYVVNGDNLDSCFFMRSNDFYLGNPFNIASYAFLNHVFAKFCNRKPGRLVFMGADIHLYTNALAASEMLLDRLAYPSPTLSIDCDLTTLEDVFMMSQDDVELSNYKHHGLGPKVEMAV